MHRRLRVPYYSTTAQPPGTAAPRLAEALPDRMLAAADNPGWNRAWQNKLSKMSREELDQFTKNAQELLKNAPAVDSSEIESNFQFMGRWKYYVRSIMEGVNADTGRLVEPPEPEPTETVYGPSELEKEAGLVENVVSTDTLRIFLLYYLSSFRFPTRDGSAPGALRTPTSPNKPTEPLIRK
jgi:hypothetical protein